MSAITVTANTVNLSNGRLGIGMANPNFPVHIATTNAMSAGNYTMIWVQYSGNPSWDTNWGNYALNLNCSLYAVDGIHTGGYLVAASGTTGYSDYRIKKDIVELDDNESLNLINQLEVKKYKYKDVIQKGNLDTYGFIAQQVEDIIPLATITISNYLPSIYEVGNVSTVNDKVLITIQNSLDLDNTEIYGNLTTPLNFKFYDGKNKELELNVIRVNDTTLQLDGNFSISNGNLFLDGNVVGNITEDNKLFVYGPKVDDFKTLNKDKIFSVGISAIQELSRKNTALENKVTTLETQLADVLSRLSALENT